MGKFKVGDKVKVLDGSKIRNYTASWCPETMGRYVDKVYEVEEVLDPYEKNKVAYLLKGCNCYKFDERGLELAAKFKVGDKIIGNEKSSDHYSITTEGWIGTVTHICDDGMIMVRGKGRVIADGTYAVDAEYFDLYVDSNNQKIVITTDGKTTTAVLYDGKKRIKDAKAMCGHNDTFDFGIGAALAVERLMGNPEATLPENNEFLNVKIYIIDARGSSTFETGKIYEIEGGRFTGSASSMPYDGKMKDLNDLAYYLCSDSDRDNFKVSGSLSHHCSTGVRYQVLESE